MAIIKPFRGIRYNPDRIDNLSTVVSQPYDRVRYGLQDEYYALSDYNITRIIKGKTFESDDDTHNVYSRARDYLDRWLEEGILIRETHPALYVYHQEFTLPSGESVTRKAVVCAFELCSFDEGIVLPHERTLSGPKVDRLNLSRATETYFGNIFMLYPDPENRVDTLLASATEREPDIDIRELHEKDVRQMLWIVTDAELIQAVADEMAPKRNLIIADGHHRYETALNYRAEQREKYPDAPSNAGFNYRLVTLVSMSNPGLTILPTHRLIFDYDKLGPEELLDRVSDYFVVDALPDRVSLETRLASVLGKVGRLGLITAQGFNFLTLKDLKSMESLTPQRTAAWRELDVSILHELLLEEIMGLSKESIERKENINYLREPDMGYDQVNSGEAQFLFVLNPTRMDQVISCTEADEKMPQKSTDFYPKVITGLTMLPVGPQEQL
jgi:uncharacterized protein (DUF1015 family)